MNKNQLTTKENTSITLQKTKSLINITNKLLSKNQNSLMRANIDYRLYISKGHRTSVTSVTVTPDGKYIVSGSDDKTIKLWDIQSGKEVRISEGPPVFKSLQTT